MEYFREREREEIVQDKAVIKKNAGKTGLAKICVNSFLGKQTE